MHLKIILVIGSVISNVISEDVDSGGFITVSTTQRPSDQVIITLLQKQLEFCSKLEENNRRLLILEFQMFQNRKTLDKTRNASEKYSQHVEKNQHILKESRRVNEDLRQELLQTNTRLSEMQVMLETEHKLTQELIQELNVEKQKIVNIEKILKDYASSKSESSPRDCQEVMKRGNTSSGIYWIQPGFEGFLVVCDMTERGGGWTVFQNRFDGSQDFYLNWTDYTKGFGNLSGEFWLGLEHLHQLTENGNSELLIKLVNKNHSEAYAYYTRFGIGSEEKQYSLDILEGYRGDAGESLNYHQGMKFCTKDRSQSCHNCSNEYEGAWWFRNCFYSHLNGKYLPEGTPHKPNAGINWFSFSTEKYSLLKTKMMVRQRKL